MSEILNASIEAEGEIHAEVETGCVIRVSVIGSGPAGKSAYSYAKDGGYTGTEEEFAEKLAHETEAIPEETLKEILRGVE